jgi:hypothetical protein
MADPRPTDPRPTDPRPADPRPNAAGGALIALGMIGGAAIGFAVGQATPGFLIGTALGVVVAILVWLRDRR